MQRPGHQDRCNLLTFTVCIPDLAGDPHQILGDEPIYLLSANPWVLEGTQFRCKIIWGSLETESEKESYFLQKWDLKFSRFQIRCYINIRKSDLLRNTLLGGNYQWKELQSIVLVFRSAQSNMANAKRQWWWRWWYCCWCWCCCCWCWWGWWWWGCMAIMLLSLAGTKPACREGKTTISILEEKYGSRERQTRKIEIGNSIGAFWIEGSELVKPWYKLQTLKTFRDELRKKTGAKWVTVELRRKRALGKEEKGTKTLQQIFAPELFQGKNQIFAQFCYMKTNLDENGN